MSWDFPEYPDNWPEISARVKERDGYRCVRCGVDHLPLHAHHIIPLSKGGSNRLSNLITLCEDCHADIEPWVRKSGIKPLNVSYQHYLFCEKCQVEYPFNLTNRFCSECNSFLYKRARKIEARQECFIATAAYGSILSEKIDFFRIFRDTFLSKTRLGRKFVGFYYFISPPISYFISLSERRRFATRIILNKILYLIKKYLGNALSRARTPQISNRNQT